MAIVLRLMLACGIWLMASSAYSEDLIAEAGKRADKVTRDTSAADLRRIYGHDRLKLGSIVGEEGPEPVSEIYDDSGSMIMSIIWANFEKKEKPTTVRLYGDQWRTREGVRLGTSLKEIERINGGPVSITGWGWDYAGTIVNYKGGSLSHYERALFLRLSGGNELSPTESQLLIGDANRTSSDNLIQKKNPTVYEIVLGFH